MLDRLEAEAQAIAGRMALAVREEVAEYSGVAVDPAFAAQVLAHGMEHVLAFVNAGRAGRPPRGAELDFVRERGARRARELLPLDALLETYLIGQRTVWEAIVEAAGDTPDGLRTAQALTGFTFGYTHAINVAVAQAYLAESQVLASEAERVRRDLLDRLLSDLPPGIDEERRAEALGLRPDGEHVVVVADVTQSPDAEHRIVLAITGDDGFAVARHGEVVGIVPRGPREVREALELSPAVDVRAGVSAVCTGLTELPRGYAEARRALRHAAAGTAVVALEEIPLFDYLAEGADDIARRLVPLGTQALIEADQRAEGALSATLIAYAESDLNVARAAVALDVHANTVHYRLGRVQELSDRDPRRFGDLVELITALRLLA